MKKGGFMKDAWILFAITLISGLLLGAVYQITKVPIQLAEAKESLHKYQIAYPDAVDFVFDQAIQDQVAVSKETLKEQKPEYGNVAVSVALKAVDASGRCFRQRDRTHHNGLLRRQLRRNRQGFCRNHQ